MIGQLTFHSCYLYILIDFGTTYSFITCGIIKRLRLEPTFVDSICIVILDGDKIISNQMMLR